MQYGLTVEVHPNINPLSESDWQSYFPGQVEPKVIAGMSESKGDYLSIVVKSEDKPILLVPMHLKEELDLGLIESVVNDAGELLQECTSVVSEWYTNIFFGRRVTDLFQSNYVVISPAVVPGSTLNKEALDQAFRVFTSLSKTMPVALMGNPRHDASMVKATAAENLV